VKSAPTIAEPPPSTRRPRTNPVVPTPPAAPAEATPPVSQAPTQAEPAPAPSPQRSGPSWVLFLCLLLGLLILAAGAYFALAPGWMGQGGKGDGPVKDGERDKKLLKDLGH
jgi:hypothetical protein